MNALRFRSPASAAAAPKTLVGSAVGGKPIQELDSVSFYEFLQSSEGLCVVDYYTDWCGPCQLMHKEVEKLAVIFKTVSFAKLNCSNCEEFSTRQRIRALPTFRLYHKGVCLDEVTGAKPQQLRQLLTHYRLMTSIA
ncbi:Thioredoxin [Tetrabaena socialis]|uniref:Thioredoxin n=1 Tax=Tetrabaena socialis TaxID=47790 RepID=A0A2J8A9C3_9CHLO|nr:Thioredoxin [Tetrabaena socialis]|eukprot:PNH09095.1 Thioredoxin [Tetrabaena socialis]